MSLMDRVEVGPACWTWTGSRDPLGYGQTTVDGRRIGAHRAVYEERVGPIPDGLVIDHLCRNPSCVNPDHLEPVTQSENVRRGLCPSVTHARHAGQTHCKYGHEFTLGNTYVHQGIRHCRECGRKRSLAHYHLKQRTTTQ